MTITPEVLRNGLIEALRLASSAEAQGNCAARVPIAIVPAEVFCCWEDLYYPEAPIHEQTFSKIERDALAAYEAVCDDVAKRLPDNMSLAEFQARPEWRELASAAERALAVLFDTSGEVD